MAHSVIPAQQAVAKIVSASFFCHSGFFSVIPAKAGIPLSLAT